MIVVVAFIFVWQRLQKDWQSYDDNFLSKLYVSSLYLNIAILLLITAVNWALDASRWSVLVSNFQPVSRSAAIKQTLAAHVASFITPAKTGEYGAKALYFSRPHRKKIVVLNFLGNMYQMLATLVFGTVGFGLVCYVFKPTYFIWYVLIVLAGIGVCFLIPRNLSRLRWSIKGHSWQRVRDYVLDIPKSIRIKAKIFSFIKYAVFSHQFYFLLVILDVPLNYPIAMGLIASMYLLSSLVPVMQFFDVVVRGGVAVLLFGWAQVPPSVIVIVTTTMWLFNVVLPLIPGSYFLMRFKTDHKIDTVL